MIDDISERRPFHRGRLALQIQPGIGRVSGRDPVANVFKTFSTSIIDTIGGTCQDPRQGWKKRGDRSERRGNICGTRPAIIGTFPLTSRNGERGTHGAARRDNQRDFSDTSKPSHPSAFSFFFISSRFPDHLSTLFYIYIWYIRFSPSIEIFFFKVFESRSISIS